MSRATTLAGRWLLAFIRKSFSPAEFDKVTPGPRVTEGRPRSLAQLVHHRHDNCLASRERRGSFISPSARCAEWLYARFLVAEAKKRTTLFLPGRNVLLGSAKHSFVGIFAGGRYLFLSPGFNSGNGGPSGGVKSIRLEIQ